MRVTERVVETFEVVEIEHQQRELTTMPMRTGDLSAENLHQASSVAYTGQEIGGGERLEAAERFRKMERSLLHELLEPLPLPGQLAFERDTVGDVAARLDNTRNLPVFP